MNIRTNVTTHILPGLESMYCKYVSDDGLNFTKIADTHATFSVDLMRYMAAADGICLYASVSGEVTGDDYKNLVGTMEINGTRTLIPVSSTVSRKNKKSSTRIVTLSCMVDRSQHHIRAGDTFKLNIFCKQGITIAKNVSVFYNLTPDSGQIFSLPRMNTRVRGSLTLDRGLTDGTYTIDGLKSISIKEGAISLNFEKVIDEKTQAYVILEKLY